MNSHSAVYSLRTALGKLVLTVLAALLAGCGQTEHVVVTATPSPTPMMTSAPAPAPTVAATPEPAVAPGLAPTPSSLVLVTTVEGETTEVYANTLRFTWKQGGMFYTMEHEAGLPLVGGTTVAFAKMERFDLVSDKPWEPPLYATITLLDGETVTGEIFEINGHLTGETDLGSFDCHILGIKSAEFRW